MNFFRSKLLQSVVAVLPLFVPVFADDSPSWNYKNQGKDWPDNFPICANGMNQSPIDLIDSKVYVTKNLQLKGYGYTDYEDQSVSDRDAIKLPSEETGRFEVLFDDGRQGQFKPVQFHFHSPSEHTKNGRTFPLELHIVHVDTKT